MEDRDMNMDLPMRAWTIVNGSGQYQFTIGGFPELYRSRDHARSQNIDWRNGSRVVRVEIRAVRTNNKRRKRK